MSSTGAPLPAAPVGRLAPTPSAGLHVGNLFAALVAWLAAKSRGGSVLLRIEDLDGARCRPTYADSIRRDYETLGLTWDNEEIIYQSQRTGAYGDAFALLQERGLVYPCFCSRADLHAVSAPHRGEKPVYAGTCAALTAAERARRLARHAAAWRLRVPDRRICLHDGLQGPYEQDLRLQCGDFIIKRSDGVFAYQLAVVVDDLAQGVTQVVRGTDLLDSTPQQRYLQELLAPNAPAVEYLHLPLLVDAQGRRLSKRDHDQTLDGILGHFPTVAAFIGYLAGITGLAPTTDPLSAEGLLQVFSLEGLKGVKQLTWRLPENQG